MLKTNWHLKIGMGIALLGLLEAAPQGDAQTPPANRTKAINFSAPKNDLVSSNLNELQKPSATYRNLDTELKKNFDVFGNSSEKSAQPATQKPHVVAPDLSPRQRKERLNKRAEQMFLSLEPEEAGTDEELFSLKNEKTDPYKKKLETPLDRYYDRMDRNRVAVTNRADNDDLFGDKKGLGKNSREEFGLDKTKSTQPLAADQRIGDRNPRLPGNGNTLGEISAVERGNLRPGTGLFGNTENSYERNKQVTDTRMENFKKLLNGNSASRNEVQNGSAYGNFATTPANATPVPTPMTQFWTPAKSGDKTAPAKDFATSAGLVGTPAAPKGLEDFSTASSLYALPQPAQPAKPLPPPTFKIPKRRF